MAFYKKILSHNHSRKQVLAVLCALLLTISACGQSEEAVEAPPENATAQTNTYMVESVFDTVLRQTQNDPQNASAWYHLADLYFRASQYDEAVKAYQKTVELDPEKAYAYSKLGSALSQLNRLDEAAQALETAAEMLPNPAVQYNNLGIVYGKQGRVDDEIKALKNAIEHRPRYAAARVNLGVVYLKKGDIEAAKDQFKQLEEFDQRSADLLLDQINKAGSSSQGSPQ